MPRHSRRPSSTAGNDSSTTGGTSQASAGMSNAHAIAALGDHATSGNQGINSILQEILAGDFAEARSAAHAAAEQARASDDQETAGFAGLGWQIAQAFDDMKRAMGDENYESAKGFAANAATQARSLLSSDAGDAADLQQIVASAGEGWNLAKDAAAKKAEEGKSGRDAPMVDQHQFDHPNSGAFCGIATMIMMLQANALPQGQSRNELQQLADRVYHPGDGTSGAQMASVLRERGLKDSTYTTTGTMKSLIENLDKGQAVPFGVMNTEGTVTRLEGGASERYPWIKPGDPHYKTFPGSGHWVLVTGYEGKAEAPTAFLVNDPDLGGELRCTPEQIDNMGVGSGEFWMVGQG